MSSLLLLMQQVAKVESQINLEQQKLIDAIQQYFAKMKKFQALGHKYSLRLK